ncbi:Ion transport 2 domain protein [Alkaliphilus metalliredigens QYMF]|uniref:Ion transport 2 domain protein n=2 Tax=Alkaliphilus TaxID=114627 RepID=A6TLR6_ALKMQ|nr:Ion transport 2 domain protein [Alkaliphilus metalliredigens QYMF]
MEVRFKENKKLYKIYEYSMVSLALIVVSILIFELMFNLSESASRVLYLLDNAILGVFIVDYILRLIVSTNKKVFIKKNVLDLIAIMPFSSIFRAFRLARLVRLARLSKFNRLIRASVWLGRFKDKLLVFVKTNGLIYMIVVTMLMILVGATGIYLLGEMSFVDGIWWAFVTATTVGYGDISPVSLGGRVLAGVLMLVGIGFIGMLTGTIATYFLAGDKRVQKTYKDEMLDLVKDKLNNFEELTSDDIDDIHFVLKGLKNKS